jgi:hypothetical protein
MKIGDNVGWAKRSAAQQLLIRLGASCWASLRSAPPYVSPQTLHRFPEKPVVRDF